mgnify:CR=1 FL=1
MQAGKEFSKSGRKGEVRGCVMRDGKVKNEVVRGYIRTVTTAYIGERLEPYRRQRQRQNKFS